jgi:hypothetical protein
MLVFSVGREVAAMMTAVEQMARDHEDEDTDVFRSVRAAAVRAR